MAAVPISDGMAERLMSALALGDDESRQHKSGGGKKKGQQEGQNPAVSGGGGAAQHKKKKNAKKNAAGKENKGGGKGKKGGGKGGSSGSSPEQLAERLAEQISGATALGRAWGEVAGTLPAFVADMRSVDANGKCDLSRPVLDAAMAAFREHSPEKGLLIVSSGPAFVKLCAFLPPNVACDDDHSAEKWLLASCSGREKKCNHADESDDEEKKEDDTPIGGMFLLTTTPVGYAYGESPISEAEMLKIVDSVRTCAFLWLKKECDIDLFALSEAQDTEDEEVLFDWDGNKINE